MAIASRFDLISSINQHNGPTWQDMIQATSGTADLQQENPAEHAKVTTLFLDRILQEADEELARAMFALCKRNISWHERVLTYCTDHFELLGACVEYLLEPPACPSSVDALTLLIEKGNKDEFQKMLEQPSLRISEEQILLLMKLATRNHLHPCILGTLLERYGSQLFVQTYAQELLELGSLEEPIRSTL